MRTLIYAGLRSLPIVIWALFGASLVFLTYVIRVALRFPGLYDALPVAFAALLTGVALMGVWLVHIHEVGRARNIREPRKYLMWLKRLTRQAERITENSDSIEWTDDASDSRFFVWKYDGGAAFAFAVMYDERIHGAGTQTIALTITETYEWSRYSVMVRKRVEISTDDDTEEAFDETCFYDTSVALPYGRWSLIKALWPGAWSVPRVHESEYASAQELCRLLGFTRTVAKGNR